MASSTTPTADLDNLTDVRPYSEALKDRIAQYIGAGRETIDERLGALDKEWTIERLIETEAPLIIGLGVTLGLARSRKWFFVSAITAGMVILHSVGGWYLWVPLLRRMGWRTQNEIEQERTALRMLRGDYESFQPRSIH